MRKKTESFSLARYKIVDTLGTGGMGTVFLAHHEILDRSVALKVPRPELAHNEMFVQRFLREARALGTLNHPNIVTVYDAGIEDDTPYIAMEYVAGDTLYERILEAGQIDVSLAIRWGMQMTRALAYLHDQNILHRDLKSANVIVNERGDAVIADFGIAQIEPDSTLTRGVLGTPSYISPEQAMGRPLDARSDLYSLGIILYECLAGDVPFRDTNHYELLQKVVHQTPAPLFAHRPDTPKWLSDLIIKCLSKSPDVRFESGKSLLAAFERGAKEDTRFLLPAATQSSGQKNNPASGPPLWMALANAKYTRDKPTEPRRPEPTVTLHHPRRRRRPTAPLHQRITPLPRTRLITPIRNDFSHRPVRPISLALLVTIMVAIMVAPYTELSPGTANSEILQTKQPAQTKQAEIFEREQPPLLQEIEPRIDPLVEDALEQTPTETPREVEEKVDNNPSLTLDEMPTSRHSAATFSERGADTNSNPPHSESFISYGDSIEYEALPDSQFREPARPSTSLNVDLLPPAPLSANARQAPNRLNNPEIPDLEDRKSADEEEPVLHPIVHELASQRSILSLTRALNVHRQKNRLRFGDKRSIGDPPQALVFLINPSKQSVRSLLIPTEDGWEDYHTGRKVTEEKGRFYEWGERTHTTLKWWLHEVEPIWVELRVKTRKRSKKKQGKGW